MASEKLTFWMLWKACCFNTNYIMTWTNKLKLHESQYTGGFLLHFKVPIKWKTNQTYLKFLSKCGRLVFLFLQYLVSFQSCSSFWLSKLADLWRHMRKTAWRQITKMNHISGKNGLRFMKIFPDIVLKERYLKIHAMVTFSVPFLTPLCNIYCLLQLTDNAFDVIGLLIRRWIPFSKEKNWEI